MDKEVNRATRAINARSAVYPVDIRGDRRARESKRRHGYRRAAPPPVFTTMAYASNQDTIARSSGHRWPRLSEFECDWRGCAQSIFTRPHVPVPP
jgi:hypothetical protein